jgi:hypothetical protein
MEMISKKIEKYNKVVKLINNEIENLIVMLKKSIRINIELDYDRYDDNEPCMSNAMSLDRMLTLYADVKIKGVIKKTLRSMIKETNTNHKHLYQVHLIK